MKYSMSIVLPWQPRNFLREQYSHLQGRPLLASVITLCGSAENAYASTCEAYVRSLWPEVGPRILELLQQVIESNQESEQSDEE